MRKTPNKLSHKTIRPHTEQSSARAGSALGRLRQDAVKNADAWDTAGTAMTGFGLVAVSAVALAITKYAQFDKAMSNVQAATHATAADMEVLREAAIRAGADTAYSAEEAAGAIEELAKAGVSTKDILGGGLSGALSLAAAGELDVAQAAEIAASAMTQFGLSGADIPHIADLLAAGAGKAQGSVEDMGAALNQVGLVASSMGLTIEETTGGLAAFASAGLTGSDAGTSFKAMLQRLNPQSKEAATKMAELGISAYDAEGNFIGLEGVAESLKTGMSGLSEEARASAMNVIFGSDAVRAANVLYEQGAAGIAQWTDAVDAAGYAAVTASIKQDNLMGDIEKLGGAIDTALIKGGSGAGEVLRDLVQGVEGFVDALGRIPEPILSAVVGITGILGVTALAGGAFLKLAPRVIESATAFRSLGTEGSKIPGTMGKVAKGLSAVVIAAAGLQILGTILTHEETLSVEEYGNAILKVADAGNKAKAADLDSLFSSFGEFAFKDIAPEINGMADAIARISNPEFGDGLNQWADDFFDWTGLAQSETTQVKNRLADLGDQMGMLVSSGGAEAAADAFNLLTKEFESNGKSAQDALDTMPGYRDALDAVGQAAGVALTPTEMLELATGKIPARMQEAQDATALLESQYGSYTDAAGKAVPITEEMAKALADLGISAEGAITILGNFAEALAAAGLLTLSARDAGRQYQAAIDAVTESVATNGTTMDINTEAGRANQAALDGVASAGLGLVTSMASATDATGANIYTQAELQTTLRGTYDQLIAQAGQFGITGGAADTLARSVLGIPKEANIDTWMSDFARMKAEETTGVAIAIPDSVRIESSMSGAAKAMAEGTTAASNAVPEKETIDSWMSDKAFVEAIRTRAASLNIPESEAIDSFMSSAARGEADATTAKVLGIPKGASISSYMEAYARIEADALKASLDRVDGRSVNTYSTHTNTVIEVTERNEIVRGGQKGRYASGGKVTGYATGGRVPTTGPGTDRTDGILGISTLTGEPTSFVDAGEWVINPLSSEKYDRELEMMNAGTFPTLTGLATGGRAGGLRATAGESNDQWGGRWDDFIRTMENSLGQVEDWVGFEDGSGWMKFFNGSMAEIDDGVWTLSSSTEQASRSMEDSAAAAWNAGVTADGAAGTFQSAGASAYDAAGRFGTAGSSADAAAGLFGTAGSSAVGATGKFQTAGTEAIGTAGAFQSAGQTTTAAAAAILEATARVSAAGQVRPAAKGGGLTARAGEQNSQWQGRQKSFVDSVNKTQGAVKEYSLHEDGSGQIVLEDGRKIEVLNGRWQFVKKFKYGPPSIGRTPYHATGGRLPTTGPGTDRTDGILGVDPTGAPLSWLDGGEQITSRPMTEKHSSLLWAIHRDDPRLAMLPAFENGGRMRSREFAPSPMTYAGSGGSSGGDTIDYQRLAVSMVSAVQAVPVRASFSIAGREFAEAISSVQMTGTRGRPANPFLK